MTNKSPIVGISSSLLKDKDGTFPGYERTYLNYDYVNAIISTKATPLILPFHNDKEILKRQVDCVDAIILSGGYDINPLIYKKEPLPLLGEILPRRDEYELNLLSYAIEKKIPILGICRGLQLINVYFGGTLLQDMSYKKENLIKHFQGHSPQLATHTIKIEKDSLLYKIYQTNTAYVNSFHHQAIEFLGNNLYPSAKSLDGIIEAIEHREYPFLLGVQWHPEMLFENDKASKNIFKTFIESIKG